MGTTTYGNEGELDGEGDLNCEDGECEGE